MKYILTEKQLEVVEIGTARGRYDTSPENALWDSFEDKLKKKHKIESFKKYYSKVLGNDTKKIGDKTILNFFLTLSRGDIEHELPEEFKKEDILSGFSYYIAENYFDLKKGLSISYVRIKDTYGYPNYFFFDSAFKTFVGMILTSKTQDLPKKSLVVRTSAAVKSLIGRGYGSKMYLTVIDDVDYLQSDTLLFTVSLRMWRDVLPKYVNVWAVVKDEILTKYIKQTPGKRIKTDRVNYFVASSHHDYLG